MEKETNYNAPAMAYTLVISALIFTLCYLTYISIPYTQTQIEQGGVEVNYGNSDQGMGDDFSNTENPASSNKNNVKVPSEKINNTKPIHSGLKSPEKEILTQNLEDADAVNSGKNSGKKIKKIDAPLSPPQPKPEKLNSAALYKGPSSSGSGQGDGNTGKPGNQGIPNGSVLSHSYTGTGGSGGSGNGGNGKGGGITLSLAGRKFVSKPSLQDDGQTEGKVIVSISVDKTGTVVDAEVDTRGTTIQDEALWRKCEKAVFNSKLNSISNGSDTPVNGKVVFYFKLL